MARTISEDTATAHVVAIGTFPKLYRGQANVRTLPTKTAREAVERPTVAVPCDRLQAPSVTAGSATLDSSNNECGRADAAFRAPDLHGKQQIDAMLRELARAGVPGWISRCCNSLRILRDCSILDRALAQLLSLRVPGVADQKNSSRARRCTGPGGQ